MATSLPAPCHYQPGDHLVSHRGWYTHHGIYLGNGNVIHYSGLADGLTAGPICETSLTEFENGYGSSRRHHHRPLPPAQIIARARSRLGEDSYNLLTNNCEHFAYWCVTGQHHSRQIGKVVGSGLAHQLPPKQAQQLGQLAATQPLEAAIIAAGLYFLQTETGRDWSAQLVASVSHCWQDLWA